MNHSKINRRSALQVAGGAVLFSSTVNIMAQNTPETLIKSFHDSLSSIQKKAMLFPWEDERKSYVSNNWNIVDEDKYSFSKFYTSDQQKLIKRIFEGLLSKEGVKKYSKQVKDDANGFGNFTCALFGTPGKKFELVITGRHLTLRADGNSIDKAAFGGPIFYGHATKFTEGAAHNGNVWWHQAVLANAVYTSLDDTQKKTALLKKSPRDTNAVVELKGKSGKFAGISGKNMTAPQKKLFNTTVDSLLNSYRDTDAAEARKMIEDCGGLNTLHMSFYSQLDTGDDKVWDRWLIEGPGFVWFFRGSPHVHAWVNIGIPS